mgnify:CR=1 FL=1
MPDFFHLLTHSPCRSKKATIASLNSVGFSTGDRCPAPAIVVRSAEPMLSFKYWEYFGGVILSCSAARTRTGWPCPAAGLARTAGA